MSRIYSLSNSPETDSYSGILEVFDTAGGAPYTASIGMEGGSPFEYVTAAANCSSVGEVLDLVREHFCAQHALYLMGELIEA